MRAVRWQAVLLFLVSLVLLAQCWRAPFLTFDDALHISNNPQVTGEFTLANVFLPRSAATLLQQRLEPRLCEMVVAGQRLPDAAFPHDHEGDAVRHRPLFVSSSPTGFCGGTTVQRRRFTVRRYHSQKTATTTGNITQVAASQSNPLTSFPS